MDNTSFFIFHFFVLSFSFFFFLAPVSKRFYVTNYTDISFFTCSVKEKQNNTVKFKFGVMGFFGCSSVAECSGVAECFGVAGCSGILMFPVLVHAMVGRQLAGRTSYKAIRC